MNEFSLYKLCALQDITLQYGKLTLCNVTMYNIKERKYKWQVHCDDRRVSTSKDPDTPGFSKLYTADQLDDAIKKFIELKNKVSPRIK